MESNRKAVENHHLVQAIRSSTFFPWRSHHRQNWPILRKYNFFKTQYTIIYNQTHIHKIYKIYFFQESNFTQKYQKIIWWCTHEAHMKLIWHVAYWDPPTFRGKLGGNVGDKAQMTAVLSIWKIIWWNLGLRYTNVPAAKVKTIFPLAAHMEGISRHLLVLANFKAHVSTKI